MPTPAVMWRGIDEPWLQNAAYVGVIAWEVLSAVVLGVAVVYWVRERGIGYRLARALSTVGLLQLVALFLGGFIVIGGEWFQMWRSTAWNGLDPAFRNTVVADHAGAPPPAVVRAEPGAVSGGWWHMHRPAAAGSAAGRC